MKNIQKYHPSNIKIASIVKAELLLGAKKSKQKNKNLENIAFFLFPLELVPFDDTATEIYAEIRATLEKTGKIIGPNDLIIAATVPANNGILITNNEKEFCRVPKLKIQNWTK